MRLYRINYHDASREAEAGTTPARTTWKGTQADARAATKELRAEMFERIETEEVDVPTDKTGLLAFLNVHCAARETVEV